MFGCDYVVFYWHSRIKRSFFVFSHFSSYDIQKKQWNIDHNLFIYVFTVVYFKLVMKYFEILGRLSMSFDVLTFLTATQNNFHLTFFS